MNASVPLPRISDRTILRQFVDSDLACFQAYRSDPEIARYQDWESMTDEEALSFIQYQNKAAILVPGDWYQIAIADRSTGMLIGDIGVYVDSEEKYAEIGFSLARHYQKRGLGRESVREAIDLIFEHTRVEKIIGITDERNQASANLLTALGMKNTNSVNTEFREESCTELEFTLLRN